MYACRDVDDLPVREAMQARWHFHYRGKGTRHIGAPDHRKDFNDHMSPLIGFLVKHVGQDWNEVYAEIKERGLSTKSMLGVHFMFHLWGLVKRNVILEDGIVVRCKQTGNDSGLFYIHPVTGALGRFA